MGITDPKVKKTNSYEIITDSQIGGSSHEDRKQRDNPRDHISVMVKKVVISLRFIRRLRYCVENKLKLNLQIFISIFKRSTLFTFLSIVGITPVDYIQIKSAFHHKFTLADLRPNVLFEPILPSVLRILSEIAADAFDLSPISQLCSYITAFVISYPYGMAQSVRDASYPDETIERVVEKLFKPGSGSMVTDGGKKLVSLARYYFLPFFTHTLLQVFVFPLIIPNPHPLVQFGFKIVIFPLHYIAIYGVAHEKYAQMSILEGTKDIVASEGGILNIFKDQIFAYSFTLAYMDWLLTSREMICDFVLGPVLYPFHTDVKRTRNYLGLLRIIVVKSHDGIQDVLAAAQRRNITIILVVVDSHFCSNKLKFGKYMRRVESLCISLGKSRRIAFLRNENCPSYAEQFQMTEFPFWVVYKQGSNEVDTFFIDDGTQKIRDHVLKNKQ